MPRRELPNRLRALRKAAGFRNAESFADACAEAGFQVAVSTIKAIEVGDIELNERWMRLFAKALGCQPWDLMLERGGEPLAAEPTPYPTRPPAMAPDRPDYPSRAYYLDLFDLAKAIYGQAGRPVPERDLSAVALDLWLDNPYDGTRAALRDDVQAHLAEIRDFLRAPHLIRGPQNDSDEGEP